MRVKEVPLSQNMAMGSRWTQFQRVTGHVSLADPALEKLFTRRCKWSKICILPLRIMLEWGKNHLSVELGFEITIPFAFTCKNYLQLPKKSITLSLEGGINKLRYKDIEFNCIIPIIPLFSKNRAKKFQCVVTREFREERLCRTIESRTVEGNIIATLQVGDCLSQQYVIRRGAEKWKVPR